MLAQQIADKMTAKALRADELNTEESRKVIQSFGENVLPYILEQYGVDDDPAISEGFSDYTDSLCKDGEISEETYNNITFDYE